MEFPKIALTVTGIPLESVALEGLRILHSDGRKEAFSGFVQYHDETMFDALTRTATEMNATFYFEPPTDAPD